MIGNDDGEAAELVIRTLVERTVQRIERFKNVIRERENNLAMLLERTRFDLNTSFIGSYVASNYCINIAVEHK